MQETSYHGSLISSTINYWVSKNLFEQIDDGLKEGLLRTVSEKLNIGEIKIEWDNNPVLIDAQCLSGNVFFKDENNVLRCINFHVSTKGLNIKENEKN